VPIDGFGIETSAVRTGCRSAAKAPRSARTQLITLITRWVKEAAHVPVIVKLNPKRDDVREPARAAAAGGADAISLINTINSLIGVEP